jgi:protein-tyrosine phosphatase
MIIFDRIIDRIFVGTCPTNLIDVQRLKQAGITAVLNLQSDIDFEKIRIDWPAMEQHYQNAEIVVYRVKIVDFDDDNLTENLPGATQILANMIDNDHSVYVHCTAGMQRSPSVVIGYLAWSRRFGLNEAVKLVMTARNCDPPLSVLENVDALVAPDN